MELDDAPMVFLRAIRVIGTVIIGREGIRHLQDTVVDGHSDLGRIHILVLQAHIDRHRCLAGVHKRIFRAFLIARQTARTACTLVRKAPFQRPTGINIRHLGFESHLQRSLAVEVLRLSDLVALFCIDGRDGDVGKRLRRQPSQHQQHHDDSLFHRSPFLYY